MNEELKKERQKIYSKRYYEKNKEMLAKKHKEYYQKKRDEDIEGFKRKKREYYQKHKEQIYKSNRKWATKNGKHFSRLCQESRRRRVEKLKVEGVINAWPVVTQGCEPIYKES